MASAKDLLRGENLQKIARPLSILLPLLALFLYAMTSQVSTDLVEPCVKNTDKFNLLTANLTNVTNATSLIIDVTITTHPCDSAVDQGQMDFVVTYTVITLMTVLAGTAALQTLRWWEETNNREPEDNGVLRRLETLTFILAAFVTQAQDTPNAVAALLILLFPRVFDMMERYVEFDNKKKQAPLLCIPQFLMAVTGTVAAGILAFEYEAEQVWSGVVFGLAIVCLGCGVRLVGFSLNGEATTFMEAASLFGAAVLSTLAAHFFTSGKSEFLFAVVGAMSLGVFSATVGEEPSDEEVLGPTQALAISVKILGGLAVVCLYIGAYMDFGETDWSDAGRTSNLLERFMALNVGIALIYFFALVAGVVGKQEEVSVVRVFSAIMLSMQTLGSTINESHPEAKMSTAEVFSIVLFAGLFLGASEYIEYKQDTQEENNGNPTLLAGMASAVLILGSISAFTGKGEERIDYDSAGADNQQTYLWCVLVGSILYTVHFPLRKFSMVKYVTPLVEGTLLGLLSAYIGFDYLDDTHYRHLTTKVVLIAFVHILMAVRLHTPKALDSDGEPSVIKFNFWDRYSTKV